MELIKVFIIISLPFEAIHILIAKNKFGKYVLPIISYILSLMNVLGLVIYNINESQKYRNPVKDNFVKEIPSYIILFIIFNIPTIIFCITNILVNKKQKNKENKN